MRERECNPLNCENMECKFGIMIKDCNNEDTILCLKMYEELKRLWDELNQKVIHIN